MRPRPRSFALIFGLAALAGPARAQNPELMLTPAERDSVLAEYDNVFPLLGRKAIERGIDLPKPLGIGIAALWVNQGIEISDLALSTGDAPVETIDVVKFGDNSSTILTTNVRADLWVLPFLSVYGLYGLARSNTTVEVTAPIAFSSSVDQNGDYFGTGLTGAFGFKRVLVAADVNWAWTKLEKLSEPVTSRVVSLRLGRAFKVSPRNRANVWLGTMNVKFKSETDGSIALGDAVPPETVEAIRDRLENVDESEWYQQLPPAQQVVVQEIVDRLLAGEADDVTVNYRILKAPASPWNLLVGGNLDVGKRWSFRAEAGLIGRYSVMVNAVYRLDL